MQVFHTNDIQGDIATLNEAESRHCLKVLRKKSGDSLRFIDGQGGVYDGLIIGTDKKACQIRIRQRHSQAKWPGRIHIALAPTKNISRTEWCVEKCTEMGVDEISFLFCDHSERRKIRMDRMEKVALSAAKQSTNAYLPKLNPPLPLDELLQKTETFTGNRIICFVQAGNPHLGTLPTPAKETLLLIGPEGDFSKREIQLAQEKGFLAAGLGESRLRTETAGIIACHTLHLAHAGLLGG